MPIKVKCLASGSTGNSYAIDDGENVLLLEAGIIARKILSGYLDMLPRVKGLLITHGHNDHARSAPKLSDAGIDIYATAGTFQEISERSEKPVRPYRAHTILARKPFRLGTWEILPLEAQHDAYEPVCFLLHSSAADENLFFVTDSFYLRYRFETPQGKKIPLNVIMVECNYSKEALNHSVAEGRVPEAMKYRIEQAHFSLENVKDFLMANDTSTVRHIYLIHISRNNGDPELFRREIQRLTGKPVTAF